MRDRLYRVALRVLFAMATGPASAAAVHFSDIVVFGDSLSDVGNTSNNGLITFFAGQQAPPPYYNGRFSNGPAWAERLSAQLGLGPLVRSSAGGDNYAAGGALAGNGTNFLGLIDNVGAQVDDYLGGNHPTGNELHVIWAGGNDFIEIGGSLGSLFSGGGTASGVSTSIANHVTELAAAGAHNFLVLNLPRLGEIPRYRSTSDRAALNAKSQDFNNQLAAKLASVASSTGADITLFDVGATFDRLLADPAAFGFTNTTAAAYDESSDTVVANPNQYVFWDAIHPTAAAHAVLGRAAFVALHDDGDFTGDGQVNADDLGHVLSRYGDAAAPFDLAAGDWDGDGGVGIDELDRILRNWPKPAEQAAAVPEPGTAILIVVFGHLLINRSNTRRSAVRDQ